MALLMGGIEIEETSKKSVNQFEDCFYLGIMRILLALVVCSIAKYNVNAQEFVAPEFFNFYPDSIAIYLTKNPEALGQEINLLVQTAFEQTHFKTVIRDTIILVPYYTLYDNERIIAVTMQSSWGRQNHNRKIQSELIRMAVIKKYDSLESAIYRVMENSSEENLVELAHRFEQHDCYGNALYVYYKLYRLGHQTYWIDFIQRNAHRRKKINPVHR